MTQLDGPDLLVEQSRRFRLAPSRSALVVIDMQYASASRLTGYGRWLASLGRAEEGAYRFDRIESLLVPNIKSLLAYARSVNMNRVFVRMGSHLADCSDMAPKSRAIAVALGNIKGNREYEFLEELAPQPNEHVVNKLSSSAFTSSGIDILLRNLGVDQLIFTGVSTSQCVDLSARDASDRGYECVVVEDAVAEDRPEFHDWTLRQFVRLFGRVAKTDDVLAELADGSR